MTRLPYTGSYEEVVKQGQQEVNRGFKPLLKPLDIELAKYDTLIIGTPVWWYSVAPAVLTFLSGINLSGKTIIPFATNGGWIGHTFQDIKKLCPESEVVGEMNIEFSESNLKTTIDELETWIKNIRKGKDNEYIGGK